MKRHRSANVCVSIADAFNMRTIASKARSIFSGPFACEHSGKVFYMFRPSRIDRSNIKSNYCVDGHVHFRMGVEGEIVGFKVGSVIPATVSQPSNEAGVPLGVFSHHKNKEILVASAFAPSNTAASSPELHSNDVDFSKLAVGDVVSVKIVRPPIINNDEIQMLVRIVHADEKEDTDVESDAESSEDEADQSPLANDNSSVDIPFDDDGNEGSDESLVRFETVRDIPQTDDPALSDDEELVDDDIDGFEDIEDDEPLPSDAED